LTDRKYCNESQASNNTGTHQSINSTTKYEVIAIPKGEKPQCNVEQIKSLFEIKDGYITTGE
jgi:UDP-N-acetylmuramoylalanine-D-glutamate ligase